MERQIVRGPACTQCRRAWIHSGQGIAAALELAVSDVGGAHPLILSAVRGCGESKSASHEAQDRSGRQAAADVR